MVNLHATQRGDFVTASALTVEEALAVAGQLTFEEILDDLSPPARRAVMEALALRIGRTPQGHVVVIWGVRKPTVAQRGNA